LKKHNFASAERRFSGEIPTSNRLKDGARVAVMGGGPAGSLFAYFLIDFAQRTGLELHVDIYEPRDFTLPGPRGCNMCAGILSESLIQMLAVDGINLPNSVVERGIDTYILHTQVGNTRLETPGLEKRIATVYRGTSPLERGDTFLNSFDGFLLRQAVEKGSNLIRARIEEVSRVDGMPQLKPRGAPSQCYDLLAVAAGVNSNSLRMFPQLQTGYKPPQLVQAFIREYFIGRENIEGCFGSHTIHFFLLDLPGIDFAAVIPKGDFVTVTLLGKELSKERVESFLNSRELKDCMPPGWMPEEYACHCNPRLNITGAIHPYGDRVVFLGDTGISRLYKDGIGAAYRTAKFASTTAIFQGISEEDFRRNYWLPCRSMEYDNKIGKLIFGFIRHIKSRPDMMHAMLRMVADENSKPSDQRRMSSILWDMFTGSAPYRDISKRFFHPSFGSLFFFYTLSSFLYRRPIWKQAA
jgi:flavin-dependent dehydrogenase